jgi:hypothetical protein
MNNINKAKNIKLILSIVIICLFALMFFWASNSKSKPEGKKDVAVSSCLQLLHQADALLVGDRNWEDVEISEIGGVPVSIDNVEVRKFQESAKQNKDIRVNYGPFIMERTNVREGSFMTETNLELIKCAQNKLIISVWQ